MTIQVRDAKALFFEAVEQHSPDEWPAFLQARCGGQADLRRYVEELLQAHLRADSLLDGDGRGPGDIEADSLSDTPYCQVGTVTLEADEIGTEIGPYKLLEQIGEGGMGIVYLAEQREPVRRRVALKIIKPGLDSRQVVARFEAERQALALMDHPNIAKVLDAGAVGPVCRTGPVRSHEPSATSQSPLAPLGRGVEGEGISPRPASGRGVGGEGLGRPYFVMELVRGVPITEYCDQARLTIRKRLELFVTVCKAVQHAHQKGIIHRDLKPSNVMVTLHDGQPVVKVIDFGVAKAVNQQLTDHTLHTGFLQVLGTPLYMSPEQAELSGLDIDTRSDIYSLGVLLYELLTGHTPFDREILQEKGLDEFRRLIREVDPPRPSGRISTLDDKARSTAATRRSSEPRRLSVTLRGELDWLVMKALEKDRNRRYETASAFAADVERYINNQPVEACPPSKAYRFRKFIWRNKGPVIAVSLVLVTLVGGIIATTWQAIRATHASEREADAARKAIASSRRADDNLDRVKEAVNKYYAIVEQDPRLMLEDLHDLRARLLLTAMPFYEEISRQKGDSQADREEVASSLVKLAKLQLAIGKDAEAMITFEKARSAYRSLADEFPESAADHGAAAAECLVDWAMVVRNNGQEGRHAQAGLMVKQAIEEYEDIQAVHGPVFELQLAAAFRSLGILLRDLASRQEAIAAFTRARDLLEHLADNSTDSTDILAVLANTQNNLGLTRTDIHDYASAESALRHANELYQRLTRDFPDTAAHRFGLASSHKYLSYLRAAEGNLIEAVAAQESAIATRETLVDKYPGVPMYTNFLADDYLDFGNILREKGDWQESEDALRRSMELFERTRHRPRLADCYDSLARTQLATGDLRAAARSYAAAAEQMEPTDPESPRDIGSDGRLAELYSFHGLVLQELREHDQAEQQFRRALKIHSSLADAAPQHELRRRWLAVAHANLGVSLALQEQTDQARKEVLKALGLLESLSEEFRISREHRRQAAADRVYYFACHGAIQALRPVASDETAHPVLRPVEYLADTLPGCYCDVEHLYSEEELEAIHEREDFFKLSAELMAALDSRGKDSPETVATP